MTHPPEQWEYIGLEFSRKSLLGSDIHLNEYGAGGWEVASMVRETTDQSGEEFFLVLMKRRRID
ncbi:hypothetical protein [Actinomadura geliboluensis]|uniref:hypothetical protein n=1 Tax=Actinomadura geliboluensis TaxID=882440 RepID=UPI00371F65A8